MSITEHPTLSESCCGTIDTDGRSGAMSCHKNGERGYDALCAAFRVSRIQRWSERAITGWTVLAPGTTQS